MSLKAFTGLLNKIGVLLICSYAVIVSLECFPVVFRRPEWILASTTVLVDFAAIPIVGMVLIHLSAHLQRPKVLGLQRQIADLAVVLLAVFLLVQPLLISAVRTHIVSLNAVNRQRIKDVDAQGSLLKSAVSSAKTFPELQANLAKLEGLKIPPGSEKDDLAVVKERLIREVTDFRPRFIADLESPFAPASFEFYRRALRNSLLALLSALAFANLAWSPVRNRNIVFAFLRSCGFSSGSLGLAYIRHRLEDVLDWFRYR